MKFGNKDFLCIDESDINDLSKRFLSKFGKQRVKTFPVTGMIFPNSINEKDIGYSPTKECIYIGTHVPMIEHEIAHMVEMNDFKRCVMDDWGLKTFIKPESLSSKEVFVGLTRETRVRAIQCHLTKIGQSIKDHKQWIYMVSNHLPFGKFKTVQNVLEWVEEMHTRTFKDWNIDRIEYEWNRRTDYIMDWMESK